MECYHIKKQYMYERDWIMIAQRFDHEYLQQGLAMVIQSLENLEKSGNKICVGENLEKSGDFTVRNKIKILYIFTIGNSAFSDKNFHYVNLNSKIGM